MFNKEIGKVNIFLYENIMHYPPTISLIQCLLKNDYKVHLVAQEIEKLQPEIREHVHFSYMDIEKNNSKSIVSRIKNRFEISNILKHELNNVGEKDIIWTVNPLVIRSLGKKLLKYGNQHIMQLLELTNDLPLFKGAKFLRFDLSKYGRNADKMVVAEINRAYIQRVEWNLKNLPYVIPNKPYNYPVLDNEQGEDVANVLKKMQKEKRKIVIYLGVLDPDREFAAFAKAIETMKDEYCLYLFGKCSSSEKENFKKLCEEYSCIEYMGFFNPPKHLIFLKYAYIALTPYLPGVVGHGFEKLNALYCAPNKIYEYAGSNVPMIGTDVLGLKEPFDKYGIGICCKSLDKDSIIHSIRYVDKHHDEMILNCGKFYDEVDLDLLINEIINSEVH